MPSAAMFSVGEQLWQFIFTHVGNTALFVKVLVEDPDTTGKKYRKSGDVIRSSETIGCGSFKIGDEPGRIAHICFTDINAIRYIQTMEYIAGWGFKWDDSCRPIEIEAEPTWAREMTSPIPHATAKS